MNIAIGIATAGRREQLQLTLGQLARQYVLPSRILVSPASPADFDSGIVSTLGLACPVEVVSAKRGLCAQRNAILRRCSTEDVLIFIDDDFYPAFDYVREARALFLAHPGVAIATHHPKLDGAAGPGIAHRDALRELDRYARSTPPLTLAPIGGAYGCNMVVRLALVSKHDILFDENLPLYGWLEDLDFSRRLAAYGRVVECSRLRGVHLGTKAGRTCGLRLGYSQVANPLYMLRKGSLSLPYALHQMLRNLGKNTLRALSPEPWVDRRGRLRGNAMALADLVTGRLDPRRVALLEQRPARREERDAEGASPIVAQPRGVRLDCRNEARAPRARNPRRTKC